MLQHCCVELRRELIDNLGLDRSSPRSSPPPCTPLLLGPCALAVYYKQPRSVISFCTFPVIFYIFQSSPQLYCSCIKQPTYSRLSKFQSELTLCTVDRLQKPWATVATPQRSRDLNTDLSGVGGCRFCISTMGSSSLRFRGRCSFCLGINPSSCASHYMIQSLLLLELILADKS